jgi:hypothetical protein
MDHAKLSEVVFVPLAPGSVYTNPAAKKTLLRAIVLHNTDSAAQVAKVYLVPAASGVPGSGAPGNRILNVSLPAGDTLNYQLPYPFFMVNQGDSLQAEAATASKVTILPLGDTEAI